MSPDAALKADTPAPMTLDEFLAWDGGGHTGKLELWHGEVRAMAPASATHAIIQLNIGSAIKGHLRAKRSGCRVGTEAPVVPPFGRRINARAPDITVTCAPPSDSQTFDDPILIIEVLSPGNEKEPWDSIESLAGLQSLQEILVVQSVEIRLEVYRRGPDGSWLRDPEVVTAGGAAHLASIDLSLPLTEVYEGTHLQ